MYALHHRSCEKLHCSSRESKLRLVLCLCLVCFLGKRRSTMIFSSNLFSKPSIRKHSCFEKLFVEGNFYQHFQEKQPVFSSLPSSPSKKACYKLYTCIFFLLCFFVTMAAFLRCANLEMLEGVDKASSLQDDGKGQGVDSSLDGSMAIPALKGLGKVYRKGTKAMSELVVAQISERTSLLDLRLFLRTLHRSGVCARADVVLLFAWDTPPSAMADIIQEENVYFSKLLHLLSDDQRRVVQEAEETISSSSSETMPFPMLSTVPCAACTSFTATISPFNIQAFRNSSPDNELSVQPIWGVHSLNTSQTNRMDGARVVEWGSIVGFDVSELNPDDTLQGFLDRPPLELRRWACYQMLLGMVRHKFKHILLTDVSGVVILRDPFTMVGNRRMGLYLSMEDRAWGTSVGHGLGIRSSLLDADPNSESEHVVTLRNLSRSGMRRQLYAHGLPARQNGRVMDEGNMVHTPAFSQDRRTLAKKVRRQHVYGRRRSSGGRRRRGRKSVAGPGGLYERVYGKRMWSSLEENERKKKLVNSAVILGSLQQIRGLANAMATEIVKVALERKNREVFPDSVLLSYLLHKSSSVLGKRVVDHLHFINNGESFVHSLVGSEQPSLFFKKTKLPYPIIHGNSKGKRWSNVVLAIQRDFCSSPSDMSVYGDCSKLV